MNAAFSGGRYGGSRLSHVDTKRAISHNHGLSALLPLLHLFLTYSRLMEMSRAAIDTTIFVRSPSVFKTNCTQGIVLETSDSCPGITPLTPIYLRTSQID